MDRSINVKVGGNHLAKDNKKAGVMGEGNVTNLRIVFDAGWDNYAKTVTFWDAHGKNPVKITLTVNLIEDITNDTRTYMVPIPPEPLAIEGMLTFVIDGYLDGKRQRSVYDELTVEYAPMADDAAEPSDPTPSQAEQLQGEIDAIKDTIADAVGAREAAERAKLEAEERALLAQEHRESAALCADEASNNAQLAALQAEAANESAQRADEALEKHPRIIDGYWYIWSADIEAYVYTGVRAQAGSEVYVGDNPTDAADVWIDPDGESAIYAPYIGENGNWYTFDPEAQTFTDSGKRARPIDGQDGMPCTHSWNGTTLTITSASGTSSVDLKGDRGERGKMGYTPIKGVDYYTEDEIEEISSKIYNAVSPAPITIVPTTLEGNQRYNFGEAATLSLAFPTIANDGDVIYLTFKSGATATTLTIDTTNTTDIEVIPEANCYYDIFGSFNGSVWLVNYSEYLVSEV